MQRGEIWWASLPAPRGSEPGHRHPVLVVQSDAFNASRIQTVVVAALTSNLRLADAPGNVLLRRKSSGLGKDTVVNLSQLVTLGKSFLAERVTKLTARQMSTVDEGLRLVLSLQR